MKDNKPQYANWVSKWMPFYEGGGIQGKVLDGVFDAAVSNFVFADGFYAKSHHGAAREFVKTLRADVSEIHFVDMRRPSYAPAFLNTPLILGQMGLIYGRK